MHTSPGAHALELRVPPVVLVIIAALLMWLGAEFIPGLSFHFPYQSIVAWMVGLLGGVACMLGILEFKRARTTVNPTKPESSSSLVRTGIYGHTRNPMYLGFFLILAGWAVSTANLAAFLVLPAFALYITCFQIKPEERILTSIFGEEFRAYCLTVRRWI